MEGFKSAETFCTKMLFNIVFNLFPQTTKSNNYLVSSHAMVLTNGARTSPHRRVVLHPRCALNHGMNLMWRLVPISGSWGQKTIRKIEFLKKVPVA